MAEITDSVLFRQRLYDTFKYSGLLSQLKTSLRVNLLERLQKPMPYPYNTDESSVPFHLRRKFIDSIIVYHLRRTNKEYTLSIYMAESDLQNEDCLDYSYLAEITYLTVPANHRSYLSQLLQYFVRTQCVYVRERSVQTDESQPLSKKLEEIDRSYKAKIDYWKLIPNSSNIPSSQFEQQEAEKHKAAIETYRIKNNLELYLRKEYEHKYEQQYLFRMKYIQKQHEGRLTYLKSREKQLLDSLYRKRVAVEYKAARIKDYYIRMINNYSLKEKELEIEYNNKMKEIEQKEKDFWKKEVYLKAKKRYYEDTIRIIKQKMIAYSGQ